MRHKLLTTCIAVTLGLATAGCATTPQEDTGEAGETVVEVTNNHPVEVTVQAVSSGADQRLGQVETNETQRFELPENVTVEDLRIQVEPVGSTDRYLSPSISVSDGDRVTVNVASNLDLTTVAVR
jgi:hypothetical protein